MGFFSFFSKNRLAPAEESALFEAMIAADVGPGAAEQIVKEIKSSANAREKLREILLSHAQKLAPPQNVEIPKSVLVAGVNGAGKTTTIGKLAAKWSAAGRKVVIGACDTFRAAANEQLDIWAGRAGAEVLHGAEPGAIAYKAIERGKETGATVILDTAGRLGNRGDLMAELSKIARVVKKADPGAPHESWLVLDGTGGQNALAQIEQFGRAAPITGLVVTKMDGTSKGGFLIGYAASGKSPLPALYVGSGEKAEDLHPFSPAEYVDSICGGI
ncbi:MAG: signal recognition particle-docking protein FtsY [Rickettsiales bacterium]|jgi:fused signal recognition particle receptor|nr:signal recognition particle-docking protein FtsY [Rickettsiales bacterium]